MKKPPDPNPRPLSATTAGLLTIDNVENYKQVLCQTYVKCLTKAARARWPNFQCRDCDAFTPTSKDDLLKEAQSLRERLFVLHT